MTFCVQRYINLHEFGHLLLIFLEPIARNGHFGAQFSQFQRLQIHCPNHVWKTKQGENQKIILKNFG
jgi:hypothetical protein